jgi:ABC-2 type transport system ATP-binding protein
MVLVRRISEAGMAEIVLQTKGLTKRYGSLTAVNDLNLEVYAGEVFGFLGPNGAGKTTSINMMCGLLKPDAGDVYIRGKRIQNGEKEIRSRVGMCPQSIVVWERLTCIEQLQFIGEMYGLTGREARQSGERLLEELDLQEKRHQQARKLSGGMQRRLNLALALVHDPEIVVLDEPEAGLDPQSRLRVREYIHSLARKKTVILTTHNMDEAERVVDRLAIIDHGRLLVMDTPEALKAQVGPGDVVEVHLTGSPAGESLERARLTLEAALGQVNYSTSNQVLRIRALHAAARLPLIMETLQVEGLTPGDVSLRANSLEDVFIQLTGRSLRE